MSRPAAVFGVLALERVGADEFGEVAGVVRRARRAGPHLDERDGDAARRELPRGLGAGETGTDDGDVIVE